MHHHHPEPAVPNDILDPVDVVHISSILAHEATTGPSHSSAVPHQTIDPGYCERLGISDPYRDWFEMVHAMASNTADIRCR